MPIEEKLNAYRALDRIGNDIKSWKDVYQEDPDSDWKKNQPYDKWPDQMILRSFYRWAEETEALMPKVQAIVDRSFRITKKNGDIEALKKQASLLADCLVQKPCAKIYVRATEYSYKENNKKK